MRILAALVIFVLGLPSATVAQTPADLRIVVIEGENAVNIIQQKTAVRPLVEVRDRNNLPVAGATVTFTIGGNGAAFAGGAQTLTVTTNAVGQAAASGFSAVSTGAVQVQVQAAFQGQLATAAITQTNFATAAAAAQAGATASGAGAGAGGGTAGGAAGGAAGGGGGLSAATIGIAGAAVAGGGVLAATQLSKDGESDENSFDGYNGPFSGQLAVNSDFTNSLGGSSSCTFTYNLSGTLTIDLKQSGSGAAALNGSITMISATSTCILDTVTRGLALRREETPVSGGPSAIAFSYTVVQQVESFTYRFAGALAGNNINGTLSIDVSSAAGANPRRSGTTSMTVTLTGPPR